MDAQSQAGGSGIKKQDVKKNERCPIHGPKPHGTEKGKTVESRAGDRKSTLLKDKKKAFRPPPQ